MASIRFLPGMAAAILDISGHSFYLDPDKSEWEFLMRALKREAEQSKTPLPPAPVGIDLGALKRAFDERGGKTTAKVNLVKLDLGL